MADEQRSASPLQGQTWQEEGQAWRGQAWQGQAWQGQSWQGQAWDSANPGGQGVDSARTWGGAGWTEPWQGWEWQSAYYQRPPQPPPWTEYDPTALFAHWYRAGYDDGRLDASWEERAEEEDDGAYMGETEEESSRGRSSQRRSKKKRRDWEYREHEAPNLQDPNIDVIEVDIGSKKNPTWHIYPEEVQAKWRALVPGGHFVYELCVKDGQWTYKISKLGTPIGAREFGYQVVGYQVNPDIGKERKIRLHDNRIAIALPWTLPAQQPQPQEPQPPPPPPAQQPQEAHAPQAPEDAEENQDPAPPAQQPQAARWWHGYPEEEIW